MAEKIEVTGLTPTYVAVETTGTTFPNNGRVFIHVKASAVDTLTILTPYEAEGLQLADRTFEVQADDEMFIGPFNRVYYNDNDGNVTLSSDNTAITVAILTL